MQIRSREIRTAEPMSYHTWLRLINGWDADYDFRGDVDQDGYALDGGSAWIGSETFATKYEVLP